MDEELHRDDSVPDPGPAILIVRAGPNADVMYVCLSPGIHGFHIHWTGKRSAPCVKGADGCRLCESGTPRKWRGYVHVINMATGNNCFLELTPTTAEQFIKQVGTGTLRGARFQLKRGNGRTAPCRLALMGFMTEDRLAKAEALDPEDSLRKIWGMARRQKPTLFTAVDEELPQQPQQTA